MSSRESGSPGAGVGELLPLTPGTSGNSSYLSNSFSSSSVNPESSTDPSPVSGESSPSSPNRGSPSMGGTVDARAAAGSNNDATRPCTRSCRSRIQPNAWKSQSRLLSHIDAQPAKLATRTAIPAMNPFRMVRFPEAMGNPLPVTVGKSAVPVSKVERDFPLRGFGRRLAASADASATAPLARWSRGPASPHGKQFNDFRATFLGKFIGRQYDRTPAYGLWSDAGGRDIARSNSIFAAVAASP